MLKYFYDKFSLLVLHTNLVALLGMAKAIRCRPQFAIGHHQFGHLFFARIPGIKIVRNLQKLKIISKTNTNN
jgi:hypothetical protein